MIEIQHEVWSTWADGELEARVVAFAAALEAHRDTVDVPRPVEHALVEQIVAAGGMGAVTLLPAPPPAAPILVAQMGVAELQAQLAAIQARMTEIARQG